MLCLLFGALATGPVGAQDDAVDDDRATADVQGQAEQADGTADGGDALKEGTELPPDHAERMREGLTLFREHVRGVLIENCVRCHGGESLKGDFDLTRRESLLASGMIGDTAEESYLLSLVRHEEEPHMPLEGDRLPDETIALLAKWIDLGAPYDRPLVDRDPAADSLSMQVTDADRQFWSFRPLAPQSPPEVVGDDGWCRTDIDRFIWDKLHEAGLRPNPSADRRTLIRRAYLDLWGLPPAPEEVEAFVADPDANAYERLIDRLLESPRYGERWARYWLDVARFAESSGFEHDYLRPHAYHYRDFVIWALNQDMPFDQFVRWQLAGDELAPTDPWALMATGFLGAGVFPTQLTEAEFEQARYDELDDMVATTGVAVLGLSVGCARCHDHKFDPLPSEDYYRMASAFTRTIRSEIDLILPTTGQMAKVQVSTEGLPHVKHHADERGYPHFYEQTFVLTRGDVHQKKSVAEPGYLQVLMRGGKEPDFWREARPESWTRTSFRRASLANWLTDPQYGAGHLAARVIVNRLWQHHFGRGIVATPNDFGLQGERPTHPELLDWLAVDLIQNGWKLKRLHKLMMTSAVYMQSAEYDADRAAKDPDNRYHWRRSVRRLDAEALRDSMLAVSGLLDTTLYGPGSLDPQMTRRSIYFTIKRSELINMMMLFDWPEHLVSIGQRATTTTAPQALLMMNSPQVRRYAEAFAERSESVVEQGSDDARRDLGGAAEAESRAPMPDRGAVVRMAMRLALGREPSPGELNDALEFLESQTDAYAAHSPNGAGRRALIDFCQALLASSEFVYVR